MSCGAIAAVTLQVPDALAAPPSLELILPAQPLDRALRSLAVHYRVSILYRTAAVAGRNIGALRLSGGLDAMLARLLEGSGLVYRFPGPGIVLVEARAPSAVPGPLARTDGGIVALVPPTDIVVTAQRRPGLLVDTPGSMMVLGGEGLSGGRSVSLAEAAGRVPGLGVSTIGAGTGRFLLRGVQAIGEPTVGLYYGETPVVGPAGTTADPGLMMPDLLLIDVDRVEVLRGPQGTLYGAGSLAGTIRILFNRPRIDETGGYARAEAAVQADGGPSAQTAVVANVPLAPARLALRVVSYARHEGGVIDLAGLGQRDADSRDDRGVRFGLAWIPASRWRLDLDLAYQSSRMPDSGRATLGAPRDTSLSPVRTPFESEYLLASATLGGYLGGVRVDANVARSHWRLHRSFDFTNPVLANRDADDRCAHYFGIGTAGCSPVQQQQWAAMVEARTPSLLDQPLAITTDDAELRLSGEGALRWTGGLFASFRRDSGSSVLYGIDPATGEPRDGGPFGARVLDGKLTQYALFADFDWHATPTFELAAGGRYFHYWRTAGGQISLVDPVSYPAQDAAPVYYTYEAGGWVGRLRADYRPGPGILLYAQVANGFRPGGINIIPGLDPALAIFRDDRLLSYETGGRISLWGTALDLDLAIYRLIWMDMQYYALSRNGNYQIISNLGRAHIEGIEAGLKARPRPWMEATLNLTLTGARLAEDQDGVLAATPGKAGDSLPGVPALALTGAIAMRRPLPGGLSVRGELRGQYMGSQRTTFRPDDADALTIMGNGKLDLSVELRGQSWTVTLGIDNITNSRAPIQALAVTPVKDTLVRRAPRRIGLSVERRF